jgi:hypothetical protein
MAPSTILEDKPVVYAFDGKDWNLVSKNINYVRVKLELIFYLSPIKFGNDNLMEN